MQKPTIETSMNEFYSTESYIAIIRGRIPVYNILRM